MPEEEALQVGEGGSKHVGDLGVEVAAAWQRLMSHTERQPRDSNSLQKRLQLA